MIGIKDGARHNGQKPGAALRENAGCRTVRFERAVPPGTMEGTSVASLT